MRYAATLLLVLLLLVSYAPHVNTPTEPVDQTPPPPVITPPLVVVPPIVTPPSQPLDRTKLSYIASRNKKEVIAKNG